MARTDEINTEEVENVYRTPSNISGTTGTPQQGEASNGTATGASRRGSVEASGGNYLSPEERRVLRAKEFAYKSVPWGLGIALTLFIFYLGSISQPVAQLKQKVDDLQGNIDSLEKLTTQTQNQLYQLVQQVASKK